MNSVIWKCVYSAVDKGDSYTLSKHLEQIKDYIVKSWQEETPEKFEKNIRICIQRIQRIERDLVEEEQETSYKLGMVAGYVEALERLYRDECEQKNIVDELAQSSGKTRQILNLLYQERERGMQHGALAEAIGSTPSSLSNMMKRILLSGAVEASRSGKNTYYMLTPAGEKYCAQEQKKQLSPALKAELEKMIMGILAGMDSRQGESNKQDVLPKQKITVGDMLILPQNTVLGEPCQVKSITDCLGVKSIEMAARENLEETAINEALKGQRLAAYSRPLPLMHQSIEKEGG